MPRVDEAQLPALRERDHDVGVLWHRVTRALRPDELARHAQVDHEHVVTVEAEQEVLAATLDPGDLAVDEPGGELLSVVVTPYGAHAVDLDGLDLAADDLALQVAPQHLHFR